MLYVKVQYTPTNFNIYSGDRVLVSDGSVIIEDADPHGAIYLNFSPSDRHVAVFVMNENGTTFERFCISDLFPGNQSSPTDPQTGGLVTPASHAV